MSLKIVTAADTPKPKPIGLEELGFTKNEAKYLRGLHWQMVMHINAHEGKTLTHEVKPLGIVRCTVTPKTHRHKDDWMGDFGPSRTTYHVEGDGEFKTMAEALKCVHEKHRERLVQAMTEAGFKFEPVPPPKA